MTISSKTAEEMDNGNRENGLKTLEAIFFVSGRFLSMQDLMAISGLNPILLQDLIEQLKKKYDDYDSAIEIVEKNNLWKMDVRQDYSYIVNKMDTGSAEFSKAEQETLAIIAYKQPIKQSVIIKIRGNKAYEHISKFVALNLLRKKRVGHTHELNLSDEFYDYFNIGKSDNPLKDFSLSEEE